MLRIFGKLNILYKSSTCLLHPFLLGDRETLVWPSSEGLPKNAVKGSSDVPCVAVNVNPKNILSFLRLNWGLCSRNSSGKQLPRTRLLCEAKPASVAWATEI